jgi:Fe-S cluster assembly protein SufD
MGAFDRDAAAALYAASPAPAWLAGARDEARAAWREAAWPTRKTEAWKYTGLEALAEADWLHPPLTAGTTGLETVGRIEGLDADVLVFLDGNYCAALSRIGADSAAYLCTFAGADRQRRALIEAELGARVRGTGNLFSALNGCWMRDGVLLHLPRGARAARPVCVVHLGGAGSGHRAAAQRLLVLLGDESEAQLIEHFPALPAAAPAFTTAVTEITLGRGARLAHQRLQMEAENAVHVGGVYAELGAGASYRGFVLATGSRLKRLDIELKHNGAGSEATLDGAYLARARQHVDLHTNVDHAIERGTTRQAYRGIVDDEARAVFNGRILIRPGAQQTSAELANRNLLLSDRAEVDTKPELEIYADDVKCAHGATVSRMDERSLYYLRSRGIARGEAERLLAIGFIDELIAAIRVEPVERLLRARLREWFGARHESWESAP